MENLINQLRNNYNQVSFADTQKGKEIQMQQNRIERLKKVAKAVYEDTVLKLIELSKDGVDEILIHRGEVSEFITEIFTQNGFLIENITAVIWMPVMGIQTPMNVGRYRISFLPEFRVTIPIYTQRHEKI